MVSGLQDLSENAIWDCYNGLLLSPDVDRIRKLLVRYELFKMSLDLPGDIIECGVFKGAGFMYWLKLLAIHIPAAQKMVVGFDTFSAFADSLLDYERASAQAFTNEAAFAGVDLEAILARAKQAGFGHRARLVPGDIGETAPAYVKNNPGFRISLLHLDFDTYTGTRAALEAFDDRVVPGGLIVLDEYGKRGWGESDAVDEFIAGKRLRIQAVPNSFQPTAYVVKPAS